MLGMVQKLGSWLQPGLPTQTDQRDIPSHTALCLAIKNGSRQRRCLPSWLLLGDWLDTGLFMGGNQRFPLYCLFTSSFLHLLHCLYLNPQVYLFLFFLFCPLSYCGEVEWVSEWVSSCQADRMLSGVRMYAHQVCSKTHLVIRNLLFAQQILQSSWTYWDRSEGYGK